jgi:ATP:corrinoid adenosyltransferase
MREHPVAMTTKKTTVISLFAGPGAGKSTSAAYLYAHLKNRGVNSELVREYVKDRAWEERQIGTYDQIYFLGKQVRREAMNTRGLLSPQRTLVTRCTTKRDGVAERY